MKPKIVNFYHLLGYKFHIPSFQRGYRWEEKQVVDLLEDLKSFYNEVMNTISSKEPSMFYCLQPIVVKRRTDEENSFDLLDGQQRLTTLYLLLSYLQNTREENSNNQKIYSLQFDTRTKENAYLSQHVFKTNSDDYKSNIDYFFIRKAYQTIESWFNNNNKQYKLPIVRLLVDESDLEDTNKRDVRVIWYEVDETTGQEKKQSSIDIFTRLNYGKIGLTETELSKALILQCDIYGKKKDIMRQWAYKVAADWDGMEKDLQNRQFWAMLTQNPASTPSHISLVLDFVAQHHLYGKQMKESEGIDPKKDNFVYAVISTFLSTDFENRVAEFWEHVQDTFAILKDWYSDRNLYHLIGLLTLWKDDKNMLFNLYTQYLSANKTVFPQMLKNQIGEQVKSEECIESLRYNNTQNQKDIIRILELFNVQTMLESQQDGARFDFYRFREQNVTSLEHIHPQNLDIENMKFVDLAEWLKRKKESLRHLEGHKDISPAMREAISKLGNLLQAGNERSYEADKAQCLTSIKEIDQYFNELAHIDDNTMHSLSNLALLDKATNAALSNRLLSEKRNLLYDKMRQGYYVPIGTLYAFEKHFSGDVPGDMKFWEENDRKGYLKEIKRIYDEYTKNI